MNWDSSRHPRDDSGRFEGSLHDEANSSLSSLTPVPASDRRRVMDAFGVGEVQVRRDHLISHMLAELSRVEGLVFYGGTALSRTHLPDLRLSEDIDLQVSGGHRRSADAVEDVLLSRFPGSRFEVPVFQRRSSDSGLFHLEEINVKVQLVDTSRGFPRYPTEESDIEQRYSDAPPARMIVPTSDSFVSMKLSAWSDRSAPRDIYDLWAMGEEGMISPDAVLMYRRFGPGFIPWGTPPPSAEEWDRALGHQCRIRVGPDEAVDSVLRRIKAVDR